MSGESQSVLATADPGGASGRCGCGQGSVERSLAAVFTAAAVEKEQLEEASLFEQLDAGSVPLVAAVGQLSAPQYRRWLARPAGTPADHPRFFASSTLEACSKTPWWVVPALWLPLFAGCAWAAVSRHGVPLIPNLAAWLALGVLAWQGLEYGIHRFAFHAVPAGRLGITAHFLLHGCHHKFPHDTLRLVFPPVPAGVLVGAVYAGLRAALPPAVALPLFAGMGAGYVAYDVLHYAIHHHHGHHAGTAGGSKWWARSASSAARAIMLQLRRRHLAHHYHDASRGFGISSPLYDFVLGTAHLLQPTKQVADRQE
jgi:dihydroceramide fatty acyl 2-hydroxylase